MLLHTSQTMFQKIKQYDNFIFHEKMEKNKIVSRRHFILSATVYRKLQEEIRQG